MMIEAELRWKKGQTTPEDWSAEWARLMKDQNAAGEAAQNLRKEITRRVGQPSPTPMDLLARVDAADQRNDLERRRQREFVERWMRA